MKNKVWIVSPLFLAFPVFMVLIAVVANNKQLHLQMFGRIAEKILDAGSREKLTVSEDIDEIYDFLNG